MRAFSLYYRRKRCIFAFFACSLRTNPQTLRLCASCRCIIPGCICAHVFWNLLRLRSECFHSKICCLLHTGGIHQPACAGRRTCRSRIRQCLIPLHAAFLLCRFAAGIFQMRLIAFSCLSNRNACGRMERICLLCSIFTSSLFLHVYRRHKAGACERKLVPRAFSENKSL